MACKWNPSFFECSLLIEFAWTLYVLAMCGGTIFHRNRWSFSKCSENYKFVISDYNFFVSNALYVTNPLQVIIECHSCSANVVLRACAWRLSMLIVRALPSVHAIHDCARILFAPSRPCLETRPICATFVARAWSYPFPLVPAVVLVGTRRIAMDSHLRLPTTTLVGSSKKSYYSKVNLEQ